MKSKKKIVALVLCAVVLVVGSVMGTMAWLTSQTETVNNTFTVGNVAIDLDETDVDLYGVKDGEDPVKANEYKLIPGHTYIKDPTVHVKDGEPCWLFVKVTNDIKDYEGTNTIAAQMAANGWTLVDGKTDVYAYAGATVPAGTDVPVFATFTIAGTAEIPSEFDGTVTIQAYAVQADNFASAAAAWTAAPCTGW